MKTNRSGLVIIINKIGGPVVLKELNYVSISKLSPQAITDLYYPDESDLELRFFQF